MCQDNLSRNRQQGNAMRTQAILNRFIVFPVFYNYQWTLFWQVIFKSLTNIGLVCAALPYGYILYIFLNVLA